MKKFIYLNLFCLIFFTKIFNAKEKFFLKKHFIIPTSIFIFSAIYILDRKNFIKNNENLLQKEIEANNALDKLLVSSNAETNNLKNANTVLEIDLSKNNQKIEDQIKNLQDLGIVEYNISATIKDQNQKLNLLKQNENTLNSDLANNTDELKKISNLNEKLKKDLSNKEKKIKENKEIIQKLSAEINLLQKK